MDQMAIGGNAVHWGDQRMYAELMLQHEMRSYHMAQQEEGPVIFDRGIPELPFYFALCGLGEAPAAVGRNPSQHVRAGPVPGHDVLLMSTHPATMSWSACRFSVKAIIR